MINEKLERIAYDVYTSGYEIHQKYVAFTRVANNYYPDNIELATFRNTLKNN
jgi:hypothetical protein